MILAHDEKVLAFLAEVKALVDQSREKLTVLLAGPDDRVSGPVRRTLGDDVGRLHCAKDKVKRRLAEAAVVGVRMCLPKCDDPGCDGCVQLNRRAAECTESVLEAWRQDRGLMGRIIAMGNEMGQSEKPREVLVSMAALVGLYDILDRSVGGGS